MEFGGNQPLCRKASDSEMVGGKSWNKGLEQERKWAENRRSELEIGVLLMGGPWEEFNAELL